MGKPKTLRARHAKPGQSQARSGQQRCASTPRCGAVTGTRAQAIDASRFPCASPSGKAEGSADFLKARKTVSIIKRTSYLAVFPFFWYVEKVEVTGFLPWPPICYMVFFCRRLQPLPLQMRMGLWDLGKFWIPRIWGKVINNQLLSKGNKFFPIDYEEILLLQLPSLKLTAKAPENGWLEYCTAFLFGFGLFSGAFAVRFREYIPIFFREQKKEKTPGGFQDPKTSKLFWRGFFFEESHGKGERVPNFSSDTWNPGNSMCSVSADFLTPRRLHTLDL